MLTTLIAAGIGIVLAIVGTILSGFRYSIGDWERPRSAGLLLVVRIVITIVKVQNEMRSSTSGMSTTHLSRSPGKPRPAPAMAPDCRRWYRLVVLASKLMPPTGREECLDRVDEGLWDTPADEHRKLLKNFFGSAPAWLWDSWVQAVYGRARAVRRAVAGSSDRDRQG